MNYDVRIFLYILIILPILIFGIFLLGCTLPTGGPKLETKQTAKLSNGLLINKIYYNDKVAEMSDVEIKVELKNVGADASDVEVSLIGLTDAWKPQPPITKKIDYIKSGEIINVTFNVKAPRILENRTDKFGVRLKYKYSSLYEAKIIFEKDKEGRISEKLDSERLIKPAPLNIKLANIKKDLPEKLSEKMEKIVSGEVACLYFNILNEGTGVVVENIITQIERLVQSIEEFKRGGMMCLDLASIDLEKNPNFSCCFLIFLPEESIIKESLPKQMIVKEVHITLNYKYSYATDLDYKILIYKLSET
ncbi:MAG: hypothetical protein QXY70_03210 [Nanopusillaceae archaeon]